MSVLLAYRVYRRVAQTATGFKSVKPPNISKHESNREVGVTSHQSSGATRGRCKTKANAIVIIWSQAVKRMPLSAGNSAGCY